MTARDCAAQHGRVNVEGVLHHDLDAAGGYGGEIRAAIVQGKVQICGPECRTRAVRQSVGNRDILRVNIGENADQEGEDPDGTENVVQDPNF